VTRVVGIVLVRNEDVFVERAVRNVLDFCDELLLCDNESEDETFGILERIADEQPEKVTLHRIRHPSVSHDLIAPRAGEPLWAFAVDGDELYDPRGLAEFRTRLLGGEFDDWWLIRSNMLHAVELDRAAAMARGYLSPPAPSMVKLYNFALIDRWDGFHHHRLNGAHGLVFKPGLEPRKLELGKQYDWDRSPFRCLHACFLPRSSRDRADRPRANVRERHGAARLHRRVWRRARERLGIPQQSTWKLERYREGPIVEADVSSFLGPE
jgi:glycosyltransferase involved in cell wall biosynthesis